DVDQQVGGTAGAFFREDGGHHLRLGVDAEGPLHRNEYVVGGGEVGGAAPGQAAPLHPHDLVQLRLGQVHLGQHFHGVGGAGGGGDGAARGLGAQQAKGGDDGHHDHRGAVAGDAADAVLVHHPALPPVEFLAGIDHGSGEAEDFVPVQARLRYRDD